MADAGEPRVIDVEEEVLGDFEATGDIFFRRVGAPVPLFPSVGAGSPLFDRSRPPLRPLCVSDRHAAVFLAHPNGLLVVHTKNLIEAAKEVKDNGRGRCVQDCCIIEVPIEGEISLVALSHDDSIIVVAIGGELQFFLVASLFSKEKNPSWSCKISSPVAPKDFKWQVTTMSYVVLSNDGSLHHGCFKEPLKNVADNVDAVDFSPKGNYVIAARGNILSILSSDFKEQCSIYLSFQSWSDTDISEGIMKVDSIAWIHDDSIVVGCIRVAEDGSEVDYSVQVIRARSNTFLEASPGPFVVSFLDIFPAIWEEIFPGSGPYLSLCYLNHWDIAVACNKKSFGEHVVLLKFLSSRNDEKNVSLLELDDERYIPRIDLQEDGEENLLFGLAVERTTLSENFSVQVGADIVDLAPKYILLCLTSEGKVIMYYIAGHSDSSDLARDEVLLDDSSGSRPSSGESSSGISSTSLMRSQNIDLVDVGDEKFNLSEEIQSKVAAGEHSSCEEPLRINDSRPSSGESSSGLPSTSAMLNTNIDLVDVLGDEKLKLSDEIQSKVAAGDRHSSSKEMPTHGMSVNSDGQLPFSAPKIIKSGSVPFDYPSVSKSGSAALMRSTASSVPSSQQMNTMKSSAVGENSKESSSSVKEMIGESEDTLKPTGLNLGISTLPSSNPIVHGTTKKVESAVVNPPAAFMRSYDNHTKVVSHGEGPRFKQTPLAAPPTFSQSRPKQISESGLSVAPSTTQSSYVTSYSSFVPGKSNEQPPVKVTKNTLFGRNVYSEQDLAKKFYSVNDMASELDSLLLSIEENGGFRDSCINMHEPAVAILEDNMCTLSKLTDLFKNNVKDQLLKMEDLQNEMSQVSARKVYLEGIVSRLSGNQYWEVWNNQQLNPEFELKRQNILKANQILTHQLVELERHFNSLEINSSSGNTRLSSGRKAMNASNTRMRQTQLHGLRNALNSQLAAAEQLSESLSKQMTMLNINSPLTKRGKVAKQLFESIGLTHEAGASDTSDAMRPNLSMSSSRRYSKSAKDYRKGAVVGSEPETARRRRESLDRSLASLEPQKTTVKRMSQQQRSKIRSNQSFRSGKEEFDSEMAAIAEQNTRVSCSSSMVESYFSKSKALNEGMQKDIAKTAGDSQQNSVFKWVRDSSAVSHRTEQRSTELQEPVRSTLPHKSAQSQSAFRPVLESSVSLNTVGMGTIQSGDKSTFSTVKPFLYSTANTNQTRDLPFPKASSNASENLAPTQNKDAKAPPSLGKGDAVHMSSPGKQLGASLQKFATSPEGNKQPSKDATPPVFPLATSTVQAISTTAAQSSSIASASKLSSVQASPFSFPGGSDVGKSTQSSVSAFSFPSVVGNSTQSSASPIVASIGATQALPSVPAPPKAAPANAASVAVATTSSSPAFSVNAATAPSGFVKDSKVEAPKFPAAEHVAPATSTPGGISSGNLFPALNAVAQPALSQPMQSGGASAGKHELSASTGEDEMEEEAPSSSAMPNIGAFGGFGLGGPVAPSNQPRPNPFGGSFTSGNQSPGSSPFSFANPSSASSQFSLTSSPGTLFRPASLSIPSAQQMPQPQSSSANAFGSNVSAGLSGFGQPAQIGAGQQALGSVLGSFGQSRQFGSGVQGGSLAPSGFGSSGFSATSGGFSSFGSSASSGGFAAAATVGAVGGGGFAGAAAAGGGFAAAATSGGGFAALAAKSGGFGAVGSTGGGFGGAAAQGPGFGSGGFSSGFGTGRQGNVPDALFTQMRK